MHDVKKMIDRLESELHGYTTKEKMTLTDLEAVDKMLHAIKNAYKIAMGYEEYKDDSEGYAVKTAKSPQKTMMIDKLEDMLMNTTDEHYKHELREFIYKLNNE